MKAMNDASDYKPGSKAFEDKRTKLLQERAKIVARLRELDAQQIASYIQPVTLTVSHARRAN